MITSFEIKNFKSIKVLSVTARPFMVLVGPNGAGKTNIVRALELFGDLLERGTTDPARELGWDQIIRREKRPARGGLVFRIGVSVPAPLIKRMGRSSHDATRREDFPDSLSIEASLTLSGSLGSEDVRVTREELTLRSSKGCLKAIADETGLDVEAGYDRTLWGLVLPRGPNRFNTQRQLSVADSDPSPKDLLLEFFSERSLEEETERRVLRILNFQRLYSPWLSYFIQSCKVSRLRLDASALRSDSLFRDQSSRDLLSPSGDGLAAAVDRLRGHGTNPEEAFSRLLRALQGVYPRIEDVRPYRIQSGRLTLLFKERGISEELGQGNVSDGVLHALALLVMLEGRARHRGVLAIEEPENAIHPWSVRAMIERAQQEQDRQVLITTHSETVVNAVKDPGSLFVVENGDATGTTIAHAQAKEAALQAILRETGQKLGDVWMGGSLGGVPDGGV